MKNFGFSAGVLQFFILDKKYDYENSGIWQNDIIAIEDDVMTEFAGMPPHGKKLGADEKGYPLWVDIPPVTKEKLVAEMEAQKQALIAEANQKTQLWQTQLMLGIITDEDKTSLTEWMLYVQKVQAVDTSAAPDIIWPEKPE